jgi:hypothetical protein
VEVFERLVQDDALFIDADNAAIVQLYKVNGAIAAIVLAEYAFDVI